MKNIIKVIIPLFSGSVCFHGNEIYDVNKVTS